MSNVMVGIRLALRAWPLTVLNYASGLLLGLVGALPFYALWHRALADRPAGDALLVGLQLMVVGEIGQYDRNSTFALVRATLLGVLAVGALVGALVAGGNFEVLLTARDHSSDHRPFFHRFFRGAGRFFGRNVRLTLLNGIACLLVGRGILAAASAALGPLGESMVAWRAALPLVVPVALAAVIWLFFFLAQEYARVALVVEDARSAFRVWVRGLWFVLRGPATPVLAWLVPGLAGLLVTLGVASATWASPVRTWGGILALVLAQQLASIFRSWTRVAVAAAALEVGLARGFARPAAPEVPLVSPPVEAPPAQGPMEMDSPTA